LEEFKNVEGKKIPESLFFLLHIFPWNIKNSYTFSLISYKRTGFFLQNSDYRIEFQCKHISELILIRRKISTALLIYSLMVF